MAIKKQRAWNKKRGKMISPKFLNVRPSHKESHPCEENSQEKGKLKDFSKNLSDQIKKAARE